MTKQAPDLICNGEYPTQYSVYSVFFFEKWSCRNSRGIQDEDVRRRTQQTCYITSLSSDSKQICGEKCQLSRPINHFLAILELWLLV